MDLNDKTAVVTGAALGTGRAIALRLAAEGAIVVVADRDAEHGQAAVRAIEANRGRASFVSVDVTADRDLRAMVAHAGEVGGGLHVLVNNAGGGGHVEPHFPTASPEQWGATLDLNLRGAMLATQLALEPMRAAGGGAVVNVASTAGLGLAPYQSPEYGAAKAGLIRFTSTLGPLHQSMNVRVNCVVPDWILTERAQEELARMTPAQRAAAPAPIAMEEVADAVIELAREDSLAGRVVVMRGGERRRLLDR